VRNDNEAWQKFLPLMSDRLGTSLHSEIAVHQNLLLARHDLVRRHGYSTALDRIPHTALLLLDRRCCWCSTTALAAIALRSVGS